MQQFKNWISYGDFTFLNKQIDSRTILTVLYWNKKLNTDKMCNQKFLLKLQLDFSKLD